MANSGYELIAKIATGGMATVHLARRHGAGGFSRVVAVKVPHEWVLDDPALAAALEREAFAASRLHHANVVSVLDVSEIGGKIAIVMEYVDGVSLSALMAPYRSALPPDRRRGLRVLLDACAGLQAAHDVTSDDGAPMAIVHRDVSPQNILVGREGVSRLTDFGIAKVRAPGVEPTQSGVVKGKLAYVAPEYLAGGHVVPASDQFSLAVLAWEVVTGRRLFKGANDAETVLRVAKGQIPLPSAIVPEAARFDAVILRALSRDPDRRFPSVREFARALTHAADGDLATHGEVAELVESACGDTLKQRRALLADAGAASSRSAPERDTAPPVPGTRVTAPLSSGSSGSESAVPAETTATASVNTTLALREQAKRRTRWLVIAPLFVASGVGAFVFFNRQKPAEPAAAPVPSVEPPTQASVEAPAHSSDASPVVLPASVQPAQPSAAPTAPNARPALRPRPAVPRSSSKPADRAPPNPYGKK